TVQEELAACLEEAQATMKRQFDRGVRDTPQWNVGDAVWLSSKNISTTRPSPKMDHKWLGPFNISRKISPSVYKLTLPLSMKGVHPVFHISVLRKHAPDTIIGRRQREPEPVEVEGQEEWAVAEILDCRKRGKRLEYLIQWAGFGPEDNSWEPESNLEHAKELLQDFKTRFPHAAEKHRRSRRLK
ncbi:hypothetical protein PTTG_30931, partial [Puccinia triticina 1-1 BBBD Race 1]